MDFAMNATKLVVGDVDAAERFYLALGLKLAHRNLGGEDNMRQKQSWLSVTGDMTSHLLILTRFLATPMPAGPAFPGEAWLCFQVPDVDGSVATVQAQGGRCVREGEDRPEYSVRAAIVSDPEGHLIELVGPMTKG